jgi:hypothetical protein
VLEQADDLSAAASDLLGRVNAADFSHLVGKTGAEAVSAIKTASPDLTNVVVVPEGSMVTMDFRTDRARVFVDASGKVTSVSRG